MTLKAVLFDLDNTLILYDENTFFRQYSGALYRHFAGVIPVAEFADRMLRSTHIMVQNDGSQTNLELFMQAFSDGLNLPVDELLQRFDKYYTGEFHHFRELMQPLSGTRAIFDYIRDRGLKIVIATNPMLPMSVQQQKLQWAGLDGFSFDLITAVDNSSYCKPNLEYYREICTKIQVPPENCLMVGNDALNDMIASRLGLRTYLTIDSGNLSIELSRALAEKGQLDFPPPDHTGPLAELTTVIAELTGTGLD
ncbi:MAG: HAD family hydrolase [Candidatus Neomarinimicrobiota bacterium]